MRLHHKIISQPLMVVNENQRYCHAQTFVQTLEVSVSITGFISNSYP